VFVLVVLKVKINYKNKHFIKLLFIAFAIFHLSIFLTFQPCGKLKRNYFINKVITKNIFHFI